MNRAAPFVLLASLAAPAAVAQEPPVRDERPNLVLFFVDDMGWFDAGFQGSRFYRTPHMDRLAERGLSCTQAYANAPNCAPSRACLMTGGYPPRHGIYTVGSAARGKARNRRLVPIENTRVLASEARTLAEMLRDAGYATWHLGKWHLGSDPTTQGFEVNRGGNAAGHPKRYFAPYRNPDLADGPDGEYLTDRLTDEALALIEARDERPFFLYFAHYAVHTPLQAPESVTQAFRSRSPVDGQDNPVYAAMLERTDASLGRLLERLDSEGLTDNTLVILTSDNGGHGAVTSMGPLRGSKGMLYEGGIRIPFVASWPGRIEGGRRSARPVMLIDLYPTLAALAAAPGPWPAIDGVDLAPLLFGTGPLPERDLFWHFPAYLEAYGGMTGPWRTTPAGGLRSGRWKLLEFFETGSVELYDLAADPGESLDLAAQEPERTAELAARLSAWRTTLAAPVPTEPEARYRAPGEDR